MSPAAAKVINYKGTFWSLFTFSLFSNMTFIFLSH